MKRDESIDVQIEISAGWKVVKGFCVELHRKNFSQIFANQSDWVGVRLSEEGYIIWWASASLEVSAAVNNMYKHEYTCVRLKMYLKITHTHRCTVGIHVPWAETQRVLLCRHPTAHSTGLMPWNFHWSSLNTEYEIQNTYTTRCRLFCLHFDCARVAVAVVVVVTVTVAVAVDVDVDVYVSRCHESNIDGGVPHKGKLTKGPRLRWHMAEGKLRANHGLKNGIYHALASPSA